MFGSNKIVQEAAALDQRRQEQADNQVKVINRLLRRIAIIEEFATEAGIYGKMESYVQHVLAAEAAGETPTAATD